jgi:hypothetical protein
MPIEGPGRRYVAVATKATTHGAPVVELNHAGVAAKSAQIAPMTPSVANAAIAQQIAIGETFVIMLGGRHEVATASLPGGAVAGTQLWITPADNSLKSATAAGLVKFGVIDSIDTVRARALVNLDQRASF